jgi:hypothetical protein
MRTLSFWQPWCWAITHLGKDVENRVWRTNYRGPLLIHAAQRKPTFAECSSFLDVAKHAIGAGAIFKRVFELSRQLGCAETALALRELPRGGIVGRVDVVGCVELGDSPWAFDDQYQWLLANAEPLPFFEVKGQRGFFDVTPCG